MMTLAGTSFPPRAPCSTSHTFHKFKSSPAWPPRRRHYDIRLHLCISHSLSALHRKYTPALYIASTLLASIIDKHSHFTFGVLSQGKRIRGVMRPCRFLNSGRPNRRGNLAYASPTMILSEIESPRNTLTCHELRGLSTIKWQVRRVTKFAKPRQLLTQH